MIIIRYPIEIYKNAFIINLMKKNNAIIRLRNNFFRISVFKSKHEINSYMIIIYPQHYHFFIEDELLIYHPNNKHIDGILKQYRCNEDFELAYNMLPINNNNKNKNNFIPKIICHRKLNYLKTFVYNNKSIYEKSFDELQNPINAINNSISNIIKNV